VDFSIIRMVEMSCPDGTPLGFAGENLSLGPDI
jgi:hypothetical protein